MPQLLNPRHEAFAQHVAMGLPYTQAAKRAGYAIQQAHNSGSRVHKKPHVAARIQELKSSNTAIVTGTGIMTAVARVMAKEQRWALMRTIIKERAADASMQSVPGGKTGLLVKDWKTVGTGPLARVEELYRIDAELLRELRALEEEAAVELAQRSSRHENISTQTRISVDGKELRAALAGHLSELTPEQRKLAAQLMPGLKQMLGKSDVIDSEVIDSGGDVDQGAFKSDDVLQVLPKRNRY